MSKVDEGNQKKIVVGLQVSLEDSQMHDCGEFGISFFSIPTVVRLYRGSLGLLENQGTLSARAFLLLLLLSFLSFQSLASIWTPAMSVSVDLPRRGRRSSVTEHIQRVFHVDRPDKVCSPTLSPKT